MTKWGLLPRHVATCPIPNCQACFYGKNTKKPWWSKTSDKEREAQHPVVQLGSCISVDMMTSPTPGLITQMSAIQLARGIAMLPSTLTRQQAWDSSGSRSLLTWRTPWKARLHLKGFVESMGSPSSTTMQTMGSLPPTHGGSHAYNKDRASLLPEYQHTTRMVLLRGR